jgi:GR25 family glycosyltransferase involved in LPS biosynthesis
MPLRGFYINLDRSEVRRQRVEAQLQKLGPAARLYQRFSAIDGRNLPPRPDVKNPAELGCYLSHMELIKANVGFDGWLHVIEDDVVISRFARQAISSFITQPTFDKFDILFTNIMLQVSSEYLAILRTLFDEAVTTAPDGQVTAIKEFATVSLSQLDFFLATSYLIHPRAIGRTADLLARHLSRWTMSWPSWRGPAS